MAYEYREVICPWCEHRFMWNKTGYEMKICRYIVKSTGEHVDETTCPKCGNNMVVLPHILEAVFHDDDRLKPYGIRGI